MRQRVLVIAGRLTALLIAAMSAGAQSIEGVVTNANTRAPVPYVNIGVPGKTVGTVADGEGHYRLNGAAATDTVRVSSLGFRPRRLTVRELLAQPTISLTEDAVALREVRVKAKGLYNRTHTLGHAGNAEGSTANLNAKDLGSELGTVIHLKRRPTKVLNVNFNVVRNEAGNLLFRINLYRMLPNGTPSNQKLLTRDIVVTPPATKGAITVDLSADQIVVDEDFLLTVEWIGGSDTQRVHQMQFAAGIGYANNDVFEREASQADWKRVSVGALLAGMQVKLGFWATVQD